MTESEVVIPEKGGNCVIPKIELPSSLWHFVLYKTHIFVKLKGGSKP